MLLPVLLQVTFLNGVSSCLFLFPSLKFSYIYIYIYIYPIPLSFLHHLLVDMSGDLELLQSKFRVKELQYLIICLDLLQMSLEIWQKNHDIQDIVGNR
jgi:hypothetical protein